MRFVYTAPRYHTNQHFPVKALLDAGHDVSFLVLRRGQSETYDALEPIVLGCSPAFEMLRRLVSRLPGVKFSEVGGLPPVLGYWKEMRRLRPSAVVVRNPNSAYGLLSTLVTKLLRARLIFYTQTPRHCRIDRRKRFFHAFVLRISGAKWITPLLGTPEQHEPAHRDLRYVPFTMQPQTAPKDKRWFAGGFVNVLDVGKFLPRKNHRLFLDAVGRLSRRYPVRATIIGECTTELHRGELEEVRRQRKRLGLDDKVDIKVNLPFSDMQEEYSKHDVFVLASRDEPAAVSPLEAMAHTLPVVCSDSNGSSCYIRPSENGFVFRTDDTDDLEVCLVRIMCDRKKLVAMGHRSYELVLCEHAPERYVDALVSIVYSRD